MAFSFFSRKPTNNRTNSRGVRRPFKLGVESLEDRSTPAVISGYVYHDVNNNGIFDTGETPLGNVSLQLKSNTTNQIVATAISDATGYYQFTHDNTVNTTPTSITKTASFPETDTNFDLTRVVDKFDPSLGTLTSIDIIHEGAITSRIEVENISRSSASTINGTVGGSLNLIAPGVNDTLTMTQNAGSVSVATYDNNLDFSGSSGGDLGVKTATATKTTTVSGAALAAWQGVGTVTLQEIGAATSNASGAGNVAAKITSTGRSTVTVRYNYTPGADLKPGPYTILEAQPPAYQDGKDALGGVPIPNSHTTDIITLTLATSNLPNNNFGELQGSSISGYVYVDANNNGIKDAGETPISGDVVTLEGFGLNGPVNATATTDATGFYQFTNLTPGTYSLREGNPGAQYLDGKDAVGSQGGTVSNDLFQNIVLASGVNGINNNYGELLPAKLSGLVYFDANANSTFDGGDSPIPGVTVRLIGIDDQGPVTATTTTDAAGKYSFLNLRPGTYTVTETQPAAYKDGAENIGTVLSSFSGQFNSSGIVGNDLFDVIVLAMGANGENFNFGELKIDDGDVGIVKTAGSPQINIGDTLTYTLTVTNYGPGAAKDLVVTDVIPSGTTLVSASGAGWTVTNTATGFTATLAGLAVGASSVITAQIRVPAIASTITNTTSVTTSTTDNNPNNNTSTVRTPVVAPPPPLSNIRAVNTPPVVGGKDVYLASTYNQGTGNAVNGQIVNALYQTILNRFGDAAGQTHFLIAMKNGATAGQVADAMKASDEYRYIQVDNSYLTVLNRAPSAAERQQAFASLKAGASEATLARQLYTSAEFGNRYASSANLYGAIYLGVTSVLPSETQSAVGIQAAGNSSLDQVIANIQQSDDGLRGSIQRAYRSILRRHADASEVDFWLGQMKFNGLSADALQAAFYSSAEFLNLARNAR